MESGLDLAGAVFSAWAHGTLEDLTEGEGFSSRIPICLDAIYRPESRGSGQPTEKGVIKDGTYIL